MDEKTFFTIIGPLSFRAADKFFRFVSWAIIISVIWYAADVTQSKPLKWLQNVGTLVFAFALLMQAKFILVRDPSDWNIPPKYHTASKVVQFFFALFLTLVCSAPFFLDTIVADLKAAKLHEIVPHPQ